MHELRKQLKSYNCNKSVLEKGIQKSTSGKQAELTELLGKWRDSHLVSMQLNKAIRTDGFKPEDLAHLKRTDHLVSAETGRNLARF